MTYLPRLQSLTVVTVLAVTAATLSAQTAPASSAAAKDETVKLEAYTVTGSNIKRIETERALPMTTVKAEQLEIYDPGQPSDLLAMLPMAAGLPGNEAALATSRLAPRVSRTHARAVGTGERAHDFRRCVDSLDVSEAPLDGSVNQNACV